jgi:hypothetical protein
MGVLDTICSVLDVNDVKIALVTMEALEVRRLFAVVSVAS